MPSFDSSTSFSPIQSSTHLIPSSSTSSSSSSSSLPLGIEQGPPLYVNLVRLRDSIMLSIGSHVSNGTFNLIRDWSVASLPTTTSSQRKIEPSSTILSRTGPTATHSQLSQNLAKKLCKRYSIPQIYLSLDLSSQPQFQSSSSTTPSSTLDRDRLLFEKDLIRVLDSLLKQVGEKLKTRVSVACGPGANE